MEQLLVNYRKEIKRLSEIMHTRDLTSEEYNALKKRFYYCSDRILELEKAIYLKIPKNYIGNTWNIS